MLNEEQTAEAIEQGTGERVTKADLEAAIVAVDYMYHGVLTICVLTLRNGFNVTGESACVDPANYNREIGDSIAYRNAFDKIWLLEGYALAERRRTNMAQSDNEVPRNANLGAQAMSPATDPMYVRMRALEMAVGVVSSGQGRSGDPVEVAERFVTFINGPEQAK
jgi:hypothetical protein